MPPLPGGGHLIVEGNRDEPVWAIERVQEQVRALLARGVSLRETAQSIAALSGWRRRRVYQVAVEQRAALDRGEEDDGALV